MEAYFKLKFIESLIPYIILEIIIIIIIIAYIKEKIDSKFKKNCFTCKYYKLSNVAGFGDVCWYKCEKNNVEDRHSMNDRIHYVKCNNYLKGE